MPYGSTARSGHWEGPSAPLFRPRGVLIVEREGGGMRDKSGKKLNEVRGEDR